MVGTKGARWGGAACMLVLCGIHLSVLEPNYEATHWLGAIMALMCIALACIGLTLVGGEGSHIIKPRMTAWTLGIVICVLLFAGFLARSTWGLPGYHPHDWPARGLVALVVEVVFVVLGVLSLSRFRSRMHQLEGYPDPDRVVRVPGEAVSRPTR